MAHQLQIDSALIDDHFAGYKLKPDLVGVTSRTLDNAPFQPTPPDTSRRTVDALALQSSLHVLRGPADTHGNTSCLLYVDTKRQLVAFKVRLHTQPASLFGPRLRFVFFLFSVSAHLKPLGSRHHAQRRGDVGDELDGPRIVTSLKDEDWSDSHPVSIVHDETPTDAMIVVTHGRLYWLIKYNWQNDAFTVQHQAIGIKALPYSAAWACARALRQINDRHVLVIATPHDDDPKHHGTIVQALDLNVSDGTTKQLWQQELATWPQRVVLRPSGSTLLDVVINDPMLGHDDALTEVVRIADADHEYASEQGQEVRQLVICNLESGFAGSMVHLGGCGWMSGFLPTTDVLCLVQNDVHGILVAVDPGTDTCIHESTLAAFGYVTASKQDRKFLLAVPGAGPTRHGVIVDVRGSCFVYGADSTMAHCECDVGTVLGAQALDAGCFAVLGTEQMVLVTIKD
ncbi:uncharacterized protein MONBRDRAFT_37455 [Monosiga brevicollis MX1]|uniref:NudC domain-containing protein 1 n=1 Tax=Monosiga brevicollis TaxID=81824 RepID=A9V1V2_MONBE|nr:uncharacterized protein MONBRDRAFT_37455 [Monosiga brevicollis MX1]EDQ88507.1 predicted protein [Monosiga brevicollis MX1]|eukprot:XP_001746611.1 hypothetical protein [Monosiga brevicollis MX1]